MVKEFIIVEVPYVVPLFNAWWLARVQSPDEQPPVRVSAATQTGLRVPSPPPPPPGGRVQGGVGLPPALPPAPPPPSACAGSRVPPRVHPQSLRPPGAWSVAGKRRGARFVAAERQRRLGLQVWKQKQVRERQLQAARRLQRWARRWLSSGGGPLEPVLCTSPRTSIVECRPAERACAPATQICDDDAVLDEAMALADREREELASLAGSVVEHGQPSGTEPVLAGLRRYLSLTNDGAGGVPACSRGHPLVAMQILGGAECDCCGRISRSSSPGIGCTARKCAFVWCGIGCGPKSLRPVMSALMIKHGVTSCWSEPKGEG
mmetsp:Transcript_115569/g.338070  ORF Transcript_115569/g.338070 Transcript_115569/m.338070 type:complete len:320 (-) Transcript_115569:191-1150(-)